MVNAAASQRWNPDVEPVREILAALDVEVDAATRRELEKIFRRRQYFHGDGRGHLTLLIRTITESEGNAGALIAPVVAAVESAMRPQWTATGTRWLAEFDQIRLLSILETMRSLELFRESSLPEYLGISIQNRLWKAFGPDEPALPEKQKPPPKPPRSITRIPEIEAKVELGRKLLDLRSATKSNIGFGAHRRKQFPDLDTLQACEMMKVVKVYGDRPEIYRCVSWQTLVELASPSLPASARTRFETAIIAGKQVKAAAVRNARSRRRGARESAAPMRRAA